MPFTVDIEGLGPLMAALDQYPEIVADELGPASQAALLSLIPELAKEPPAISGSSYRRTGTEARLWSAQPPAFAVISSGFEASIGNATPYAPWVQDRDKQAKVHRGRWATAQGVIEKGTERIVAYYNAALQRVARRLEGKG